MSELISLPAFTLNGRMGAVNLADRRSQGETGTRLEASCWSSRFSVLRAAR